MVAKLRHITPKTPEIMLLIWKQSVDNLTEIAPAVFYFLS
jgi:hypothetical protein